MHILPAVGDIVKVAVAVCRSDPLLPFTVIVPLAAGAVAYVVTVKVAVADPPAGGVTEDGVIDPVAWVAAGISTVRATGELNEFIDMTVKVNDVEEPFLTVAELGVTVRRKSGLATIFNVTVTDWLCVPDVPVIVTGYVPVGAVKLTLNVKVEDAEPAAGINIDDGENV
jgi:hypothetical protein